MRYVVDVDTWLDFLDCMVLEERRIYVLDVPCYFAGILRLSRALWCRLLASSRLSEPCIWSKRLPTPLRLLGIQHR